MEEDFESKAVDCMLGSLWKGNTKVQWNCCYAAGSFFRLSGGTAEEGELRGKLLDAVTSLMRSSTNYKVLSHAITALRQFQEQTENTNDMNASKEIDANVENALGKIGIFCFLEKKLKNWIAIIYQ